MNRSILHSCRIQVACFKFFKKFFIIILFKRIITPDETIQITSWAKIPITQILIKLWGSIKHRRKIFRLTRIPVCHISILEFFRMSKHIWHIFHATSILNFYPLYLRIIKHIPHIFYLPSISNTYTRYFWTPEHERHIFHIARISEIHRRFQCTCSVKHRSHLFYLTRIPVWEVSFLKFRCSRKHTFHIRYTTRIRYFNLLYQSTFKHTIHIFYLPSISNTYTRYFWTPEHERHIFHIARISEIHRRFQCTCSVKHRSHLFYLTRIPVWEVSFLELRCSRKHVFHIRYITRIHPIGENDFFCLNSLKKTRCIIRKLHPRGKLNLTDRINS